MAKIKKHMYVVCLFVFFIAWIIVATINITIQLLLKIKKKKHKFLYKYNFIKYLNSISCLLLKSY